MIWVFICFGTFILGFVFYKLGDYLYYRKDVIHSSSRDVLETIGIVGLFFGGITSGICLMILLGKNAGVSNVIEKDNIKYESLCKRLEIVESEYEDVSKSDVIKDIAEWNSDVVNGKYWASSLWTNWFFNKRRIDNLKTIDY